MAYSKKAGDRECKANIWWDRNEVIYRFQKSLYRDNQTHKNRSQYIKKRRQNIAATKPQAAYVEFILGLKHCYTYFIRTIV